MDRDTNLDTTIGNVADVGRQDLADLGPGSGATDAVGDAALAGVGATPAADEPVMRDRLDQETEGMLDPDRVTRTDDAADDLPRGGIAI